ncbi:hypothetical protein BTO06_12795 [Tenacibaculum sp. SZ-18]|nr:hypothetical protein BTO06_12795 [Tenacibaculum sp. SZ-18]
MDCAPNCNNQTNCITRQGLLHDANFTKNKPILGNNVTLKSDNFRDDTWNIIKETDCGNGKIPKGSNVNVLSTTPVVRTLSNGTKLNYYRIEYIDCPKGNNSTNGNFDQNKPCSDCFKGNPVKGNMQVAKQAVSGIGGGLYGNSYRKKWKKGEDGKYIKDAKGKRKLFPKWHRGIDIVTQKGDPIYAMFDGKATKAGSNNEAAGFYVKLESNINGKTILSYYFHMKNENRVSGDVKAGDIIGYQGDSGNLKNEIKKGTVPCHVHIKIKENGITVNPDQYIKGNINTTTGVITADCN